MTQKEKDESCCVSTEKGCCKVESVVSIDERGQMVLPKDIREKIGINPGDKLAIITMRNDDKICCLTLIKVQNIEPMVKQILGPLMKDIF